VTAWVLRRSSDAVRLLAALMILVVPLPGLASVCFETAHVAPLIAALVVLAAMPMNRLRLLIFADIALFCLLDHPASMFAFAVVLVVMAAGRFMDVEAGARGWVAPAAMGITVLVLTLSVLRFFFLLNPYERTEMNLETTVMHARLGLAGLPALMVLCVFVAAAAACVCLRAGAARRGIDPWPWVAVGALLLGAACIVFWASRPVLWIHGDTYRRFAISLNLPLAVVLAVALVRERGRLDFPRVRHGRAIGSVALVIVVFMHVACLLVQSTNNARYRAKLKNELARAPGGVLFLTSQHWAWKTPLRNWALPMNSVLLQGRRPTTIATFAAAETTEFDPVRRTIRFHPWLEMSVASTGSFKFDPRVEESLLSGPGRPSTRGSPSPTASR
jgi:hypothetical protein